MPRKPKSLSSKEQIFIREFLATGNGTRSAIAAGYSPASASVTGSKLLRKAKIAEELANLRAKLLNKLEITAERVLHGLAELAFFDPRKMFYASDAKAADGSPLAGMKPITELDDQTVHALTGMDVEKLFKHFGKGQAEEVGTITKIRLADRGLNLERLGRHFKLFTDKLEVTDSSAILARLQKGRERAALRS